MISEEIIDKIKYENDIVDVISENVRLKRIGRNYVGLCPFHHEKTPSFYVSPQKQIFKCFGCGEAGNVITFIMKLQNKTFPEACEYLAKRANIDIPTDNNKVLSIQKSRYDKMYSLNVEAARFFFRNLKKNITAKNYLLNRGITEKTINKFGLGYALDDWNSLFNYLKSKGYSELDMVSAGLISKNSRGNFYDLFKNRVMFPVFNIRGKVIGFGGRVLNDAKPKYLNSPETLLFKKGTNLYGLNFAIKSNNTKQIIIVEGYMDCISLHQYGITNAVASLGTALTSKHAKLLKRYTDDIIISYDADAAGQAATLRGLEILKKEGFNIKVLTVPMGKDPDEFIKSNGADAFLKLLEGALPLVEYRIERASQGINLKNREHLIKYIERVSKIIVGLDPIEKDVYINKISENTGVTQQAIYDIINTQIQKNVKKTQKMNSNIDFRQKLYLEPLYIKAERSLLKLMLNKEANEYIKSKMSSEEFVSNAHRRIFELIVECDSECNDIDPKKIESKCYDTEMVKEWIYISEINIIAEDDDLTAYIDDCINEIIKFKLEESRKKVMANIKYLESKGMFKESIEQAQRLMKIEKKLLEIKSGERRE